jgi:hypothetical protein
MSVKLLGNVATPRSVILENDFIRLEFPLLASGHTGAHTLYTKSDSVKLTEDTYGDWVYFYTGVSTEPTACRLINQTEDKIEIAFEFTQTVTGMYARDAYGNIIYPESSGVPREYTTLRFFKLIKIVNDLPGYFVGYHTIPLLTNGTWIESDMDTSAFGEREFGLGWVGNITFDSNGTKVLTNPETAGHTNLGMMSQACGPYWFATILRDTNHVRYISTPRATPCYVLQDGAANGRPIVYKMTPRFADDGTIERYQAFSGVFPYTMTTRAAEPTAYLVDEVIKRLPTWSHEDRY